MLRRQKAIIRAWVKKVKKNIELYYSGKQILL